MATPAFHEYARKVLRAAGRADAAASEAQRDAVNHRVGRVHLHGYQLSITHPKGSVRRGTSADGTKWERLMACHYGYVRRTTSSDGEQLDVFLGDHPESQLIFVVDQLDDDGNFDEYKCVMGCRNYQEAKKLYLSNYPDGWEKTHLGEIRGFYLPQFREWLKKEKLLKKSAGDASAPVPDRIPGGLADGKPDSDFPAEALAKGREVEREHTSDPAIANEIAKDHLRETHAYYDRLEKVEKAEKSAWWSGLVKLAAGPLDAGWGPGSDPKTTPTPGTAAAATRPPPAGQQWGSRPGEHPLPPKVPAPTATTVSQWEYDPTIGRGRHRPVPITTVMKPSTATAGEAKSLPDSNRLSTYRQDMPMGQVVTPAAAKTTGPPGTIAPSWVTRGRVPYGPVAHSAGGAGRYDPDWAKYDKLTNPSHRLDQSTLQGVTSGSEKRLADETLTGLDPHGLRALTEHLHSYSSMGPILREAAQAPGLAKRPIATPEELADDPVSWNLYRRWAAGREHPIGGISLDDRSFAVSPRGVGQLSRVVMERPSVSAGYKTLTQPPGLVARHEMGHVTQYATPAFGNVMSPYRNLDEAHQAAREGMTRGYAEIVPSLTDVPILEQWVRDRQKYLGYPVTGSGADIPLGMRVPAPRTADPAAWRYESVPAETIRRQAEEHGVLDGADVAKLLNTNAGRKWLEQRTSTNAPR